MLPLSARIEHLTKISCLIDQMSIAFNNRDYKEVDRLGDMVNELWKLYTLEDEFNVGLTCSGCFN